MKKPPYYIDDKRIVVLLVQANAKRAVPCEVTARVIARLFASIDGGV